MRIREKPSTLLVADDDPVALRLIGFNFDEAGLYCQLFESGDELLEVVNEDTLVCLLDVDMPGTNGIECLERIKKEHPHVEVIMLTNLNEASEAVHSVRAGAFDYLTKPFDPKWLVKAVRSAMQLSRQEKANFELRHSLSESKSCGQTIGESPAMQAVQELMLRVSPSDKAVLLTGESGTGKTLLARTIHNQSNCSEGPFVSVSCPCLPADLLESEMFGHEKGSFSGAHRRRLGKVELAEGGTIFLDEVGEIPLQLQPKLLSYLQEKSFSRIGGEEQLTSNARIIAATNRDLKAMVEDGRFREDLYFRLNVLPIEVPPLRDRKDDIRGLFDHFITRLAEVEGRSRSLNIEPGVYEFLLGRDWPGNVRELENTAARAYVLRAAQDRLQRVDFDFLLGERKTDDKPGESKNPRSLGSVGEFLANRPLSEIEQEAIKQTILACGGNKKAAAKALGIAEKSIYNKINKYEIDL